MNPLGDETGALAAFGICTVVVLSVAIVLRSRRHPIAISTLAGLVCGMVIYAVIAGLSLLVGGTGGYRFATWLVLVVEGMIPAGIVGLAEGLIASVIVRLFEKWAVGN